MSRGSLLPVGLVLLVGGCFDPDRAVDEVEATETQGDTGEPPVCEPGASEACTCDDGSASTRTCRSDGSGFGACACMDDDTTGDPPPECERDSDCSSMSTSECEEAVCGANGTCSVQPLPAGTACGDASEGECTAADSCDGAGSCSANHAANGTPCASCDLGVCACAGGTCGDCSTFADGNTFTTERSIAGWELTGDWGLYREAPQNQFNPPIPFGTQVLGTDGNRAFPYPGGEVEVSSARSTPFVLPAEIQFQSWHVDEGSGYDTKMVRISVDGGDTWEVLVDCNVSIEQVFCLSRGDGREPDDWDTVLLTVPVALVGQLGIIEFSYDTGDECCEFERGWFIDVANFGTECACAADESCDGLGSVCGAAVCGAAGECVLDAVEAGTACGDSSENQCKAPDACDGFGYCADNREPNGFLQCTDCPAGPGSCNTCQVGECVDCENIATVNDFSWGSTSYAGWVIEDLGGTGADWRHYFSAPTSSLGPQVSLSGSPAFGTDGNRVTPYPGAENEHSRVTTSPDVLPSTLTFQSWHQDEGGEHGVDHKLIEVSTDDGETWTVLVDCLVDTLPFCVNYGSATSRPGNQWDTINLPMGGFAGQVGRLRFTYDTGDSCCAWERGWFIDNLNFAQYCMDPVFP